MTSSSSEVMRPTPKLRQLVTPSVTNHRNFGGTAG